MHEEEFKGEADHLHRNNKGLKYNYEPVYRSRVILDYSNSDARPRDFNPYHYMSREAIMKNRGTSFGKKDRFVEKNLDQIKGGRTFKFGEEEDTSSESFYINGSTYSSTKGSSRNFESSIKSAESSIQSNRCDYLCESIRSVDDSRNSKNSIPCCNGAFCCIRYILGILMFSLSIFVILKTGIMDKLMKTNTSSSDHFVRSTPSPIFIPNLSPSMKPSVVLSNFPSATPSDYPTYGNGNWLQVGIIQGNELYGMLGRAISLDSSGKYIAVSSGVSSPKVTVYRAYYDEWVPVGTLVGTVGGFEGEYYGSTVKLVKQGSILAIGNMYYNNSIGIVQIFSWANNAQWAQVGQDLTGNKTDDGFGRAIALSESADKVCIGSAMAQDDASGLVQCFILINNYWTKSFQEFGGIMHAISSNDRGLSMTSDGSFFAFNAPGVSIYRQDASYVKVFKWSNSAGSDTKELVGGILSTPRRPLAIDLALKDDSMSLVLAIGFPEFDVDSGTTEPSGKGGVQVYTFHLYDTESAWVEMGPFLQCDTCGMNFGRRLSLSNDGNTLAVTSNYAVTFFDWTGSRWIERGYPERRVLQTDMKSVPNVDIAINSDSGVLVTVALSMDEDGYGGNDKGKVKFYRWNSLNF